MSEEKMLEIISNYCNSIKKCQNGLTPFSLGNAVCKLLELYKQEKQANCDFASEWLHKSKIREKIEEIDIAISSCEYIDDDTDEIKKTIEGEKYLLLRDKAILKQLLEE